MDASLWTMLLATVLLLLVQVQRGAIARPTSTPLDLLVVVLDDVSSYDLALWGGAVPTPNLEALAAVGVKFDRCYGMPTCSPARRSLMTGRWWCAESGNPCPGEPPGPLTPDASEAFLPEALEGYDSGVAGKWHVGGDLLGLANELAPMRHGFHYWAAGSPSNSDECGGTGYRDWLRIEANVDWGWSETISGVYEPLAVQRAFVQGWPLSVVPRLGLVCMQLAHGPFRLPPAELLPPGYTAPPGPPGRYEAMILAWDTLLGRILEPVDLASTVVVVVADNGTPDNLAPDPTRAKGTTFERGVRVPMVIAGGPVLSGVVSDALVHLVDVWATLVELGGGAVPPDAPTSTAVSLVPLLTGQSTTPPHSFVVCGTGWGSPGCDTAIVTRLGLKFRRVDADGDTVPELEELYDLFADPSELVNLAGEQSHADDVLMLRSLLQASVLP